MHYGPMAMNMSTRGCGQYITEQCTMEQPVVILMKIPGLQSISLPGLQSVTLATVHEIENIVTVDAIVCRVVRSFTIGLLPQCRGTQPVTLTMVTPT